MCGLVSILMHFSGLIRMNPLTMNRMIDFWIGKLGHIAITFIIPSMFIPLKHVVSDLSC